MQRLRRLPIEGIPNLRDLGGWAVQSGMTKYGVFLRSAVPKVLTEQAQTLLRQYNLTTVVDFRSSFEVTRAPDPLRDMPGVTYINIPMFDSAASGSALSIKPEANFSWIAHYIRMVDEQKSWMAQVMSSLANAEGCTLFHCTTGKDRAGIVSALLLSLCGVCQEDVIADYCVSEVYLRGMYEEMESYSKFCEGDLDCGFYRTKPEAMRALLEHINHSYGDPVKYLSACGLSEEDAARLRLKFMDKF